MYFCKGWPEGSQPANVFSDSYCTTTYCFIRFSATALALTKQPTDEFRLSREIGQAELLVLRASWPCIVPYQWTDSDQHAK